MCDEFESGVPDIFYHDDAVFGYNKYACDVGQLRGL